MDPGSHGGMDHGGMDMGHGAMKCSMNMLLNSDYKATCIVSEAFRVHSIATLISYMLVLFALGVGYEYTRLLPTRLEYKIRSSDGYKIRSRAGDTVRAPLLPERDRSSSPALYNNVNAKYTPTQRALRSLLYTFNVAVSFFLMLVIMTYNTYLIASVLAGAFVGHFMFHDQPIVELDRGMACH